MAETLKIVRATIPDLMVQGRPTTTLYVAFVETDDEALRAVAATAPKEWPLEVTEHEAAIEIAKRHRMQPGEARQL